MRQALTSNGGHTAFFYEAILEWYVVKPDATDTGVFGRIRGVLIHFSG
jgi:hypothetical protein